MSARATPGVGWATDPIRAAGGRARWNRQRQMVALERQAKLAGLIAANGLHRGTQQMLARELGVSESTVSRDIRSIFSRHDEVRCPACGTGVAARDVTWRWRPTVPPGSRPLWLVHDQAADA
jgi:hypothetical protein